MTRVLALSTVLLLHTAAAWAQQPSDAPFGPPAPAAETPPSTAQPTPPAPPSPPPTATVPAPPATPPSPPVQPVPQPEEGYPPGYGPPPGYVPPPGYGPRYGAPQTYGAPPSYGPPGYPPQGYYHYHHILQPPPPRRVTDRPFTIGGGIGFGGLKLDDGSGGTWSQNGLSYTARLGIGLRPGLLLLWDIEGSTADRTINDSVGGHVHSFSQTAQLAALQMFVGDRFFLKGGFGMAQFSRDDALFTDWGGAVMGGVGLEIAQGWSWSMDIESTVTAAFYNDETLLNWSVCNFAINLF
ncbi:MAG TPA: hypothetical protein VHJ20_19735 [Polyangia bacterium]|nr:hypothetical protein [Polyangia bacterium]